MGLLDCPSCFEFSGKTVADYLRHIRLFHADVKPFQICCNLGCQRAAKPFKSFYTFRDHVYAYHSGVSADPDFNPPSETEQDSSQQDDHTDEDASAYHEPQPDASINMDVMIAMIQKAAATFLLKVQESHGLPQSTMENIIKEIQSLYEVILTTIHDAILNQLRGVQLDELVIATIDSVLSRDGPYGKLFSGLETNYLQLKYFRNHFNFVEPRRVVLGTVRKYKGTGSKRRCIEKEETMMYVPILSTLDVVLQNDTIMAEIHNGHGNTDGFLLDYCDGTDFKKHPLFSVKKNSLQLIFYYDDVEICNPLGSKRSVQKLGLFYFTLGNVSPEYRSRLSCVYLVAIVKKKLIDKYSMPSIISPFVEDVAKLESGYTFPTIQQMFYGTITFVSADNLAANLLGGFKEGSTAYRGCRHCMATLREMKTQFCEDTFDLRSLESYLEQCEELDTGPYDEYSKEYGLNIRSAFTQLKYFDLCNGSLLTDIMHDVLEGVLQYEAKLVLRHCVVCKKYFQLSFLNMHIENYELGFMEAANRPSLIKKETLKSSDHSLKQNASQMWLLARILPAIVGRFVAEDDEKWSNLVLLLRITGYLFAPRLTSDEADYLALLIEQHHQTFCDLYPDESVIPKFHYMVHMPRLIKKFGPLVRGWTMRFEARHKYFKRLAVQLGNFINIGFSLAMRHQRLQCYHQLSNTLEGEELETGPGTMIAAEAVDGLAPITSTYVFSAKWVKVLGTTYKKPCAVVIGTTSGVLPQFGSIEDILVHDEEVLFTVTKYTTLYYSEHFNSFVIQKTSELCTVYQRELYNYIPLHVRTINGLTTGTEKAVILKTHISTL